MTKPLTLSTPPDHLDDYQTLFALPSDGASATAFAPNLGDVPFDASATAAGASAASATLTQVLYLTEPGETGAINVADINQGQLGDCYLLASIGEIALQNPSFISNMIHDNGNGTTTVTMYDDSDGQPANWLSTSFEQTQVTIINNFPYFTVNGGATQDVVNGQKEIWPQVLEKAFKKLNGGWAAIGNGGYAFTAMEGLTGQAATYMSPANVTLATLQNFVTAHDLVVMVTPSSGALPYGLVNNHDYMFNGVTGTGSGAVVNLLNPWGYDQPAPIPVSRLTSGFGEVDVGHLP